MGLVGSVGVGSIKFTHGERERVCSFTSLVLILEERVVYTKNKKEDPTSIS